jgi:hypothetical protein
LLFKIQEDQHAKAKDEESTTPPKPTPPKIPDPPKPTPPPDQTTKNFDLDDLRAIVRKYGEGQNICEKDVVKNSI